MTNITEDQEREIQRVLTQMQGSVNCETWYVGNPSEWLRDLRAIFPAQAPSTLAEELLSFGKEYLSESLEDKLASIAGRVAKVEEERDTARDTNASLRQTLDAIEKLQRHRSGPVALGVAESAELVADMQEINKAMSEAGLGVPGQKVSDAVVRLVEATTAGRSSTPKESPNAHARIPTPAGAPENQAWIVKTHLGTCIGIRAGDSWFAFSGHNYSVLSHDRITLVKGLGGTEKVDASE